MEGKTEGSKKKLAICIPTYERSNIIQEFLEQCAEYYFQYDLDIYIYDSSPGSQTREIVDTRNMDNLYYVRLPEDMHANIKAFQIFRQLGFRREYEFVWMCGDSQRYTKEALDIIMPYLTSDYSIITIDGNDKENLGIKVYENRNDYCRENAWHLTLFGAAILNVKTMLQGIDWNYYEKVYSTKELINFSHVSFYFQRIAQMQDFKAIHLGIHPALLRYSGLKKKAGWYEETFFIMCSAWVETINHFPACYQDKRETIIRHGRYTLLDIPNLLMMRKEELYNIKVFYEYRKKWNLVCDVPLAKLWLIAFMPSNLAGALKGFMEFQANLEREKALKKFCRTHEKLYIYGAGKRAEKYGHYFGRKKISYRGFCVTEKHGNEEHLLSHPVYELDKIVNELKGSGIIVAINSLHARQVLPLLKEKGMEENVFWDDEFAASYGLCWKNIKRDKNQ